MADVDARGLLELLDACRTIVLTTHTHPDGDALGSEFALTKLLRRAGVAVRIVNPDPTPEAIAFLDPQREFEAYVPGRHDEPIRDADAVVMLDNSDPQRLGALEGAVRATRGLRACIDHHPEPDAFWEHLFVRLDAPCTGSLVRDLYRTAGVPLDREVATALYAALSSDTGRFRFANSSAEAFRLGAELVEAGASPAWIYAQLSERLTPSFVRVFGQLLGAMELRCEGRLVLLRAPASVIDSQGAQGEDLADVINQALKLKSGRLAALFRELQPDLTKVSLRSKGELDVNRLARRHGGGGHRNASGIVLRTNVEDAIAKLLPDLEELARATAP